MNKRLIASLIVIGLLIAGVAQATDPIGSVKVVNHKIPKYDGLLDMGSSAYHFRALYVDTLYSNVLYNDTLIDFGGDAAGIDVTTYGATSGAYMLWDESDDQLEFVNAKMTMTTTTTASDPGRQMYLQRTHTGTIGAGKGLTGIEVRSTFNGAANALSSEVKGGEFKARHTTGNTFDVGTFKGVIGNVDAKNGTVTSAWAGEFAIDVAAGGTITTGAAVRAYMNNSGTVTTSYGVLIASESAGRFTYDIGMQNGLTMDNTTDNALEFNENSDELIWTFGSNTITASSGDVTLFDYGTINLATDALDLSDGNITNAGQIDCDLLDCAASALQVGDGDETIYLYSSDWAISATGAMTGIGAITMDGDLVQGTSGSPCSSAVEEHIFADYHYKALGKNIFGHYISMTQTYATDGAPRALTIRTSLDHASGFGPQGASAVDARVTLEDGNTGISGEMHAMESQLKIEDDTRSLNGTYCAHKFTNYIKDGNTMPATTFFLRFYDVNGSSVATPMMFDFSGLTAGAANCIEKDTGASTGIWGYLRVKDADGTVGYIAIHSGHN